MKIVPLEKSNLELFVGYCYVARSDLHPGLLQGTIRKQNLFVSKIEDGLHGLMAQDSNGVIGIVEWMPIGVSHLAFNLPGAMYLHCIWVKPDFKGEGVGGKMMERLLTECGDAPLITFGYDTPEHMPRTFFEKYDFEVIEKHNDMHLMLRPAGERDKEWGASNGPFIQAKVKHDPIKGRSPLYLYHNDFCPYNWLSLQRVLEDVKGRSDIYFRLFNCNFRDYPESCGEGPTLYLNGELVTWHPCAPGFVKDLLQKQPG